MSVFKGGLISATFRGMLNLKFILLTKRPGNLT